MAGNDDSLVMLGNDFHSIVVGQYGDVGVLLHSFDEAGLYLCTRIILMVEDAEFGVAAFFVQVKLSVLLFVRSSLPI